MLDITTLPQTLKSPFPNWKPARRETAGALFPYRVAKYAAWKRKGYSHHRAALQAHAARFTLLAKSKTG